MKLSYPVTPLHINQPFGANPEYYAKFGTKGHMGIDFLALHGQPVYSPFDGYAYYVGPDEHGGDGVYVASNPDPDGTSYIAIHWHLCSKDDPKYAPLVGNPGRWVKRGELIGYADNSGAPFESSGDHLHFGLQACKDGLVINKDNGFDGCIDPQPFFDPTILASDRLGATINDPAWKQALAKFLKSFGY